MGMRMGTGWGKGKGKGTGNETRRRNNPTLITFSLTSITQQRALLHLLPPLLPSSPTNTPAPYPIPERFPGTLHTPGDSFLELNYLFHLHSRQPTLQRLPQNQLNSIHSSGYKGRSCHNDIFVPKLNNA